MFPTHDMNPIAIQKMEEERIAALENTKPISIQPLLPLAASLGALAIAAILFL